MKRLLIFIIGMSFLFSCEYLNGPTTIKPDITTEYLLNGNLDVYLDNTQVFRFKGKPGIETVILGNNDLSKYENCFILHVETGTTQESIVSSAIIELDNLEVLNTSDFSKNAGQFSFEICNLTPTSIMTIEVRGAPGSFIEIWIEGKLKEETVADCDNNVYKTVKIGDQVWMAENLKTTKLNDCTPIPYVSEDDKWLNLTTPAFCYYENNELAYKDTYGALYNGKTVATGKLCPVGWHVPSYYEFKALISFIGDKSGKLRESGTAHWAEPNTGATDEYGFLLLPAGIRAYVINSNTNTTFQGIGTMTYLSGGAGINLFQCAKISEADHIINSDFPAKAGISVRCIKD